MRVWLDDRVKMPDGYDVWVKTAFQADLLILAGKVTHISFDHDLGDGENGYSVAKGVEYWAYTQLHDPLYPILRRFTWDIHSGNPVGAKSIRQAMTNADKYWDEFEKTLDTE